METPVSPDPGFSSTGPRNMHFVAIRWSRPVVLAIVITYRNRFTYPDQPRSYIMNIAKHMEVIFVAALA
ncbi:MAG TPA: hypothetical protein VGC21_23230, partial [Telluria sp.]